MTHTDNPYPGQPSDAAHEPEIPEIQPSESLKAANPTHINSAGQPDPTDDYDQLATPRAIRLVTPGRSTQRPGKREHAEAVTPFQTPARISMIAVVLVAEAARKMAHC